MSVIIWRNSLISYGIEETTICNDSCQGCGMVDVTLKQGVEVMIKEAIPELKGVMDITDHTGGENPYYT